MDFEQVQTRVNHLSDILTALFSRQNIERAEEMREHIKACVELTLEIVEEPLKEAGITLPVTRSMHRSMLKEDFEKELAQRTSIIPFEFEKDK